MIFFRRFTKNEIQLLFCDCYFSSCPMVHKPEIGISENSGKSLKVKKLELQYWAC